jgi:hypothetical protein
MRVPASVQLMVVSAGFAVAVGATGCSKGVEEAKPAETVAAVDAPPAEKSEKNSLREPDIRPTVDAPEVSRGTPANAWMFRSDHTESATLAPASTQASITPQPIQTSPPPILTQTAPPVVPPVQTVRQNPRPPGWQNNSIRAACGRG